MDRIQLEWHSLGQLLDQAASQHGEKPLLIYEDQTMSFRQMAERSSRLASALRSLGIQQEDRVSVMLPNGFDFPTVWLALARLGAVMVPTNITYQQHDLAYLLADSQASAMIVHQDFLPVLDKVRPETPDLKTVIVAGDAPAGMHAFETVIAQADAHFDAPDVGENDLLNIQYTSGTTGFPKGCMLTHRYWMALAQVISHYFDFRPDDVYLTAQPFYYMDPQWNVVLALMHGVPLVVMHRFSPSHFWETINRHGVTFFYVLGTMPFFLMKQPEDPALEQNHKLRFVACSGIHPDFHAQFEKRWNVPWREAFGMTESGANLIARVEDTDTVGTGTMGRAVFNIEARVVDEQGQEVSRGQIGQLILRGEDMMLGYWRKPEATAEVLRDGWLYTGDLVVQDENGYFTWKARLKDMVRRSNENISTAEVEGVLMQHPAIKLAAVLGVPDDLRGEEVKAYLVLQPGHSVETTPPQQIIAFAKERLAYFKVPRYLEFVDDLPRTPSERVQKHLLIKAKPDLRTDSYDAVDGVWR
jgi:crotonobetaine/carnitine-CoA ligase